MMNNSTLRGLVLAAALATCGGTAMARSAEMIDLGRQSVVTADSRSLSVQAVRNAIIAGGSVHSWKPVADQPGMLTLEADSGQHQVGVDVAYDAQSYQITYKSSANMNYEHADKRNTIHPKYNKWIQDLNTAIRNAALAAKND
jgi:hypothetical protein